MDFSLIICTYQRPEALQLLLESVSMQTEYPQQILIIDGSLDSRTEELLAGCSFRNIEYFRVKEEERGLTRQRNYGVRKVEETSEVLFFLDDDTILLPGYFEEILRTYQENPGAVGVSGYIVNETTWRKVEVNEPGSKEDFVYDGWARKEGSRFSLRRKLGLAPNAPPGYMPDFSHGYSSGFLPPSGKIYEVEMLMGGIASYRKEIFEKIRFSSYFEGYGLYEDADFSLRASRLGRLYVNTNAKVEHHHAAEGRPDTYRYGKMVVRNGWYVWRIKNRKPSFKARAKWHLTSLLLTTVRFSNSLTTKNKEEAFREAMGRTAGWLRLIIRKPRVE